MKYSILLFSIFLLAVGYFVYLRANRRLVTVVLRGGLGNRIFQILAAQGYAEKHNRTCIIAQSFNLKGKQEHEDDSLEPLHALFPDIEVRDTIEDYEIIDAPAFDYQDLPDSAKNVVLRGYCQSERYFPAVTPGIRKTYYPNTYFIHVRAGDYLTNKVHYIDLTHYHKRTIQEIRRHDPFAKFLVFSDDAAHAQQYMKQFRIPFKLSAVKTAKETLLEMSACAGAICANSSLSWLGAYFQKQPRNHIYMPDRWINDGQDATDVYPSWANKVGVI
jgi:hypothetical protein